MKTIKAIICIVIMLTFLSVNLCIAQVGDTYSGAGAGASNTGGTMGSYNSGFGGNALNTVSSGNNNTATGYQSLNSNTASNNSAFGYQALSTNNSGTPNDAFGYQALMSNTTGEYNVAVGYTALAANVTGQANTAVGYEALATTNGSGANGNSNSAFGAQALYNNNTGTGNVAIGAQALYSFNGNNGFNVAVGTGTLYTNTAQNNSALGRKALYSNTIGANNTAVGYEALYNNGGGVVPDSTSGNCAFGNQAGYTYGNYINCTLIGNQADANVTGLINSTALGNGATITMNNEIMLGNSSVTYIGSTGQNFITSDGRFKTNVKEEVQGLEFIKKLRPVVYNLDTKKLDEYIMKNLPDSIRQMRIKGSDYKASTAIRQSGFIAQEVEQAAKVANYDFNGIHAPTNDHDNYSLAYSAFVVPLVKGMQEQQQMIENQTHSIQTLSTTVNQQGQLIAEQQQALTSVLAQMENINAKLQELRDCCNNNGNGSIAPSEVSAPQLLNAVPNPTSGSSAIYYFVPTTAKAAKIQLTYGNGTVMQIIPVSNFGYSSTVIQTSNLASGIYFYSLIVDDQLIDTKKLSVMLK